MNDIKNVKMIAFDLFGVLIRESHIISNVLMGLLPQDTEYLKVKKLYEQLSLGEMDEEDFWSALQLSDIEGIRERFITSFELDEDYQQVILELKGQYRLSVLSNLPASWALAVMSQFHFDEHFSPCVFSGSVGYKKPQADIFQKHLLLSGVKAQQLVFIDDRLENLRSAHQLGIRTIFYAREDDICPYDPDYRIRRLSDLLTLLNQ